MSTQKLSALEKLKVITEEKINHQDLKIIQAENKEEINDILI